MFDTSYILFPFRISNRLFTIDYPIEGMTIRNTGSNDAYLRPKKANIVCIDETTNTKFNIADADKVNVIKPNEIYQLPKVESRVYAPNSFVIDCQNTSLEIVILL
ncbi:MAG: hypothetical protein KatS3mg096_581 [Candidatus Parcubacteria bacterium]|nr:MAG: hypothetical protein KatS3mg096_581 [Candidatus Parcubacteria bacterium]